MLLVTRRNISIVFLAVIVLVAIVWMNRRESPVAEPIYVNSLLAIRGFRHGVLQVSPGDSKTYQVDVGEDFKITWRAGNLSENGQLMYSGPAGVGHGLITVPRQSVASQSQAPVLEFVPTQAGTATVTLTVTGPGVDGIYTVPSTITVDIIP